MAIWIPKAACQAVEKGLEDRGRLGARTRYLERREHAAPNTKATFSSAAMKRLAEQYPTIIDAATLYADSLMVPVRWRWYASDGTPAAGMPEAERALETGAGRWAEHPAPITITFTRWNLRRHPKRAVPSAQRLMGMVPWAGTWSICRRTSGW